MNSKSRTGKWQAWRRSGVIAALALCLALIAGGCTGAPETLPVQQEVLALADAQPDEMINVIVQKRWAGDTLERRVVELGGAVIQDLYLINGFAAELPAAAAAQLAQEPAVRWISLDAPMHAAEAAAQPAFVTWASANGTKEPNNFLQPANAIDSTIGPNGTYAVSQKTKAGFAGFAAEVTAGYRIAKVEAVISGYVANPLRKHTRVTSYIDGDKVGDAKLEGAAFAARVGAANAGPVYVDVTGKRQWQWGDFDRLIEVVLDFSSLDAADVVYLDAIGLRVWIEPGTDNTGNVSPVDAAPNAALDLARQVNVYNNVIGVESLWKTNHQLQGNGVGVAVVDSGVERSGDLAHLKIIDVNFNKNYHDSKDRYGHGTFVASVVAGSGKRSRGMSIGVAPNVRLVNVRVSDDTGLATASDVVAGLQWIYENKGKYNIRVVNLSLNSSVAASYLTDPLCAAVEMLWLRGIVVVVSAGNNGTATLYPPANDPFAITVGATDDQGTTSTADDTVAGFSGYGLTESGSPKPDLVTPGRNIIAYLPSNGMLKIAKDHQANRITDSYFRMSGTSMSAPMVTGVVALLLQDEPALTPDQVKFRLMATANQNWPGYDPARAGAGYVDAYAAVYGSSSASANTGVAASRLLWDSLAFGAWGSVNWNSVNWNSVNWNSVNWNSVNWNSVNWNSVNWNSVNWNSVNWNSDYWEEMDAASAAEIPAVQRLLQMLAEDEAAAGMTNSLYLPAINR